MPKVFIVIINYNSIKDTKECLDSLDKLDYSNYEIIVIDNGSEKPFESKKIKVIKSKENLGFTGGNNIGIKYAMDNKADYILLLNNDTIVSLDFLKKLVNRGEKDKKIGILGPKIYYHNSDKIWFNGGKINWLYTKAKHVFNKKNTDYISGCCMLIKRGVIEKIGLMYAPYFLYFEDVDLCLRARKRGFKNIVVHSSIIWHKVSQAAKKGSFTHIYYNTRNRFLLPKRNACFFIKILAYLSSFWLYFKQLIKFYNKEYSKIILIALKDFYKNRFGKYEES